MANNQRKILEMLADRKIGVDEAERLISLLRQEPGREEAKADKRPPKYLRVVIRPAGDNADPEHSETVNIRVPVTLLRAGIKLAALIPPKAYSQMDESLKEKGLDLDLRNITPENIEEIILALNDLEVDVQDKKQTVHVYAE